MLPLDSIREALGGTTPPGSLADFAEAMSRPKPNVVRSRRGIRAQDLPLATDSVPWYALGHRPTDAASRPSRFLAYAAADYYIQDAGSLLALAAAGADTSSLAGMTICDLCAAPGGKASALVEAVDDGGSWRGGFVLANEPIGSRIGALQLNLARTGSDRYAISNLDPDSLADRLAGRFDLVVVDAPCSGQALLGRRKQTASALSISQIRHSAARQSRILDAALRLVSDGGRIVYSTCTFAEAENELQVQRLVSGKIARPQPVDRLADYETSAGSYRLWPHLHRCAGSFAAVMAVNRDDPVAPLRLDRKRSKTKLPVDLNDWYGPIDDSIRVHCRDAVIFGWPTDTPLWVHKIAIAGPELAHRSGRTWKPSHAAALRRVSRVRAAATLDIDDDAAKAYLRGEPVPCKRHGWVVVRLGGRPLGWVKGNGTIGKNHLPTAARMSGAWSS